MINKLLNSFTTKCITKMYLQSESADVHFVFPSMELAPPEKVPAHKALLASASLVFKTMFNGNWNENKTVEITDSNASAFKELLQFIYLPEVTLTIGNIEEVVRLADKYDMIDCFDTCAEFLEANLTSKNMVWGYELAISLNNERLMEFCEKHIQFSIGDIMKSDMFLQCSREVIDHILKLDTLECDEVELFDACIEWAKASCQKNGLDEKNSENLRNQLDACFYSFRFGAMNGEEIGKILLNKVVEGVFTKDELADIMRSKWTKQSKSDLFNHHPRLKPIYAWNGANKLICKRELQSNSSFCHIERQESTWFSTNKLVLLGEIRFVTTFYVGYDKQKVTTNFDIEIIEHCTDSFATDAPAKQIYQRRDYINGYILFLSPAIAIRPHKIYEIRLYPLSGINSYKHCSTWVSEVKLDSNITIKFHQNPSNKESARRGLVTTMQFSRIE